MKKELNIEEIKEEYFCVYKVAEVSEDAFMSLYFDTKPFVEGLQKAIKVSTRKWNVKASGEYGWNAFLEYSDALSYISRTEKQCVIIICWAKKDWIKKIGLDYNDRIFGIFEWLIFPKYPDIIARKPEEIRENTRVDMPIQSPGH